jgi:opacity protein-like surface antigen
MRMVLLSGLSILAATSTALAADISLTRAGTVEDLRLERAEWSGFSGVILAGGAFMDTLASTETVWRKTEDPSFHRSGVLGGALGYDHQFGSIVVGAHLEGMATNFRSEPSSVLSVENRWLASGTVRLGFDAGRFMPYVSAGVGYGRLQVDHYPHYVFADTDTYRASGDERTTYAKTAQALVLGGGVESRLRNGVFLRADYKHFKFEEIDFQMDEPRGANPVELQAQNTVDVFNLGLGYRF